ncbi:GNAT family N-acetyltransferase [Oceanobacillus kapialis]|uniref:GNAT family N-acetyltransferase n=1 Tax=Oceanobacillus kapialis TaxID=481353 RepID=A0ABW5Q3V7_9BACI
MAIEYHIFKSFPKGEILEGIIALHKTIFGPSDNLLDKMARKPPLLIVTAMDDERVVGYKIGYELNESKFYSWLGGVDPAYRNLGIASSLMKEQHQYLEENGYKIVQTKTMNRWRGMLVLNIKNGFDVIETYTDDKGRHKIVLEKELLT